MSGARVLSSRLEHWWSSSRISILGVGAITLGVLGVLYLGLPVFVLPVALAALVLIVLTLRSPAMGLSLVIALQCMPVQIGGFTSLQVGGVGVVVLCLFWFAIHRHGLTFPNVIVPMLVTILLTVYSLNITRDSAVTLAGVRRELFNIIFCLLLVNVVTAYRWLRLPLWSLVLMGFVNSVVAFLQFGTSSDTEFRSKGLMENQNDLGEIAALASIVPFYFFLREKHRGKKVAYLALSGILALGMVASISRGATIALLSSIVFISVRERKRWRLFVVLGALTLAVIPFLPEYFFQRFSNIGQEIEGTVFLGQRFGLSTRGYYNKAAIRIWKAHPLLGVGLGNFGYYFIRPEINPGLKASHLVPPHNIYTAALAEMGLVGFLVLCWWIVLAIHNYWKAERKTDPESRDGMYLRMSEALTILVLVMGFSAESLTSTTLVMVIALSAVCRACSEDSAVARDAAAP